MIDLYEYNNALLHLHSSIPYSNKINIVKDNELYSISINDIINAMDEAYRKHQGFMREADREGYLRAHGKDEYFNAARDLIICLLVRRGDGDDKIEQFIRDAEVELNRRAIVYKLYVPERMIVL